MRKVAIVQARMQSTRLPGKVLKPLAGRTVLAHVISRVSAASQIDDVVVATSTEAADDAIAAVCDRESWHCIRGSEGDVLSRYAMATRASNAEIVVRVTSDCPLFSPRILDAMLGRFDPEQMDYMSTNYPERSFPVGLDCEVMRANSLIRAADEAVDPHDREHVTPYLYRNPETFSVHGYACNQNLQSIRITLDTDEDYERLVDLISAHPEITNLDSDVLAIVQKYFKAA